MVTRAEPSVIGVSSITLLPSSALIMKKTSFKEVHLPFKDLNLNLIIFQIKTH